MIVDARWYVPNTVIRRDLQTPTVKEEIRCYSSQYSARLSAHPYDLRVNLIELPGNRLLQRHLPNDLPTRFLTAGVSYWESSIECNSGQEDSVSEDVEITVIRKLMWLWRGDSSGT
jgi:hypothetical protein